MGNSANTHKKRARPSRHFWGPFDRLAWIMFDTRRKGERGEICHLCGISLSLILFRNFRLCENSSISISLFFFSGTISKVTSLSCFSSRRPPHARLNHFAALSAQINSNAFSRATENDEENFDLEIRIESEKKVWECRRKAKILSKIL